MNEAPPLLVCLPSLDTDGLRATLAHITAALAGTPFLAASPDVTTPESTAAYQLIPYAAPGARSSWLPAAADYLSAFTLARDRSLQSVLLLGTEADTIPSATFAELVANLQRGDDLVLPRYQTQPHEALLNAGILYPLTQALFSQKAHFPLPVDVAFSARMGSRLAAAAQKYTAINQPEALIWPVAEAAAAGFTIGETSPNIRWLPQPPADDVSNVLASVTASLFTEVEARAAFWQRARLTPPQSTQTAAASTPSPVLDMHNELSAQLESFRNAYDNLREIWSLVLPPTPCSRSKNSLPARCKTSTSRRPSGPAPSMTFSSPSASAPSTAAIFSAPSRRSTTPGSPPTSASSRATPNAPHSTFRT